MSGNAKGSLAEVTVIEEPTYGEVPTGIVDGDMQIIPITNNSVSTTFDRIEDPSLRADRQKRFNVAGNENNAGDITKTFDVETDIIFLESLAQSSFSGGVLKIGNTPKSMTMSVHNKDIGGIRIFTGLQVNTWSMDVTTTGAVSSTFGLIGSASTKVTTPLDANPTEPSDDGLFAHLSGTYKEGGVVSGTMTGLTLNVDNQLEADFVLGQSAAICLTSGMVNITGTMTRLFTDYNDYEKFIADTKTSLEFTITNGTRTFNVKFGNVVYTAASIPTDTGGSLSQTYDWEGLHNDADGSAFVITES